MSLRRSLALARHNFRVLNADRASLISLLLMPVVMIAFLSPIFRTSLQDQFPGASGADYGVPAMSALFAFFTVGFLGFMFFSEHRWDTWERLRASQARSGEIMLGKVIPAFTVTLLQQAVLFAAGVALFGLDLDGAFVAVVAVALALSLCLTGLGVLLAAVLRTEQQLNVVGNLGALVLGGLGGALVPLSLLPSWARHVAPATPQYWAVRGYQDVILEGQAAGAVVLPVVVLVGMGVVLAGAGLVRFRFDEPKVVRVA